LFFLFVVIDFYSLGGGGTDGSAGGGGSSFSTGFNTIYTTGYQPGTGNVTMEFYKYPTFKFSCTKSIQNLTVPLGYNYMYVSMTGAASGTGGGGVRGNGARVQSYFTVDPGTVLHIAVGCSGSNCPITPRPAGYIAGGYNGGGAGYGETNGQAGTGGGGASDIRIGGLSFANRIIVAGGGGGYFCGTGCGAPKGGDGGQFGSPGTTAPNGCCGYSHVAADGGSWSTGGVAGYSCTAVTASSGSFGFGGNGGSDNAGGGGGGYYGG
jgi:hypothetical protein